MNAKGMTRIGYGLIFLGPAVVCYGIIVLIPIVFNIGYSFFSWDGVSGAIAPVGWSNYTRIIGDDRFKRAIWFTVRYTFTVVFFQNLIAFLLALLLTQKLRVQNVARTLIFLPYVIAGILLGFIWQFIFSTGFPALGELTRIPFFNIPWLATGQTGFWAIVIASTWRMVGYLMVIYIAGLMTVPEELIECSIIDGANAIQKLFKIKIPLIIPSFTVCLFIGLAWEFKMFDINYSLTGGGPAGLTRALALDIYHEAFINARYGLGSAKAVVFLILVIAITFFQARTMMKKEVQL